MRRLSKVLAIVLAVAMLLGMMPVTGMAADDQKIVSLGWFANKVEVPAGVLSEFKTPESAEVVLEDGSKTTVNFDSWSHTPEEINLTDAGGEYVFTPIYSQDYQLAEGLSFEFTLKVVDTQIEKTKSTGLGKNNVIALNGIPAVINSDSGSGTYVYDATGMNKIYADDISTYDVYGGGFATTAGDAKDLESSWIVVLDGKIGNTTNGNGGLVGGGGLSVNDTASYYGGKVKDINLFIYGGTINNIYGGGAAGVSDDTAAHAENINFEMHGGTVTVGVALLGYQAMVSGNVKAVIDGGSIAALYSGSYCNYSATKNTASIDIELGEGVEVTNLYLLGRKNEFNDVTWHIAKGANITNLNLADSSFAGAAGGMKIYFEDMSQLAALSEYTFANTEISYYVGEDEITVVDSLTPDQAYLEVAYGTEQGSIGLPTEISGATVASWTVTPDYEPTTPGEYKFVPVFADTVYLNGCSAEDATITVKVLSDVKKQVADIVIDQQTYEIEFGEDMPTLPTEVTATVDDQPSQIITGITWSDDDSFDNKKPATYTFTLVLPNEYEMKDGAPAPTVTVTVKESDKPLITDVDLSGIVTETYFPFSEKVDAKPRWASNTVNYIKDPVFYETLPAKVDGEDKDITVTWTSEDYVYNEFNTYTFTAKPTGDYENYEWADEVPTITVTVFDGCIANGSGLFGLLTSVPDFQVPYMIIKSPADGRNALADATGYNLMFGVASGGVVTSEPGEGSFGTTGKAVAGLKDTSTGTSGKTPITTSTGKTNLTIKGTELAYASAGSANMDHTGTGKITLIDATITTAIYAAGDAGNVIGESLIDVSGNSVVPLITGDGHTSGTVQGTVTVNLHDLDDDASIGSVTRGGATKLVLNVDDAELLAALTDTLEDGVVEAYVNDVKATHIVTSFSTQSDITGTEGEYEDETALNLPTDVDGVPVVKWTCKTTFDGLTAGEYEFVPEFAEGVFLVGGCTAEDAIVKVVISPAMLIKVTNITGFEPTYTIAWNTDPTLPTSVTADVVEPMSMPGQTINDVTWKPEDGFDKQIPGDYTFTLVLPATHTFADGTDAPTVTVTVQPYAGALITAFEVPVQSTEFLTGTVTSPVFYDTLTVTINDNGTESTDTISGLTWKCDNYNADFVAGTTNVYTFTIDTSSVAGGYQVADSAIENAAISVEIINASIVNTYGQWKPYGDKPVSAIIKGDSDSATTTHTYYDLTGFNVMSAGQVTGNANPNRGGIWAGTGNKGKTLGAPITEKYLGIVELSTNVTLSNFSMGGYGVDMPQDVNLTLTDNATVTKALYAGSAAAAFNGDSYITFKSGWSGNVASIVAGSDYNSSYHLTGQGGDQVGSDEATKHTGKVIITIEDGITGTIGSIARPATEAWACQELEVWIPAGQTPSDYGIVIDDHTKVYVGGVLWSESDDADTTALLAAIKEAGEVERELYTEASLKVLDEAVQAANDALQTTIPKEDQSKVDALTQAIKDAITNLVKKADTTDLAKAVEEAQAVQRDLYTEASLKTLDDAVKAAEEALSAGIEDQAKADELAKAIRDAITGLVKKADTTNLAKAIEDAQAVQRDLYTEDSLKTLDDAVKAAQDALSAGIEDQAKADELEKAITDAITGLVKKADTTNLSKAIEDAKAVQRDLYTANSLKALDDAVEAAEEALKGEMDQAKADELEKAIRDAITGLVTKAGTANYEAVEEAIKAWEEKDKSTYTKASAAVVEAAIAAVEYDLPDTQQDKVDEFAKAINEAIAALKELADYSALEEVLEKVPADLSVYTDETVAALQAAINAIDDDLSVDEQDKVAEMAEAIQKAIEALERKPVPADYTAVETAIAKANAIDRSKYTDESLRALDEAVAAVEYGLTIENQAQVNIWADAIERAISNLVLKDTGSSDNKPSGPQRPNISGGGSSSGGTSGGVNTGTQTPTAQGFNKTNTYVPNVTFIDVPTDSWFYSNVQSAYEYTLMLGKTANEFKPDDTMTVAEAITIAARMNSIYNGKTVPTNSTTGNWYDSYVTYAINNGIIAAGDFTNYNANATRAQMAKIFVNAVPATWLNQINSINAIPDMEADDADTAAVLTLYRAGVCTGSDEEHNFKPDTDIKRSEVAAIVSRLANKTLRQNFDI